MVFMELFLPMATSIAFIVGGGRNVAFTGTVCYLPSYINREQAALLLLLLSLHICAQTNEINSIFWLK